MVNVKESAENFEKEVAAPGMEKRDFRIQLDNDLLTISCQKKSSEENEQDD